MSIIILTAVASTALLFSLLAMIFAFLAWSTMVGLQNSTHKIQYVPVKDPELNEYTNRDLKPKIDDETGNPIPLNNGDDSTGLGLLKQFKKIVQMDDEE